MSIKRFLLVLGLVLCGGMAMAQSAVDLELAKQLALQQGYSEEQVDQLIKQYGGKMASGPVVVEGVDRNPEITKDKVEMQQINFGVADKQILGSQEDAIKADEKFQDIVYGHDLFKNSNLNFVPSYNIPTPENYKLSAGDEIVIDIWGDVITNITATISPEGSVNIPDLGPVYLAGQTVDRAEKNLKSYLSKIYSGLANENPTTFVKLSLGRTKTVTVNVVGDVVKPGSYTLSALSTVASVMYMAEGPNDIGTIRQINLYRDGKLVSSFDLYEFIINGTFNGNLRLEDNDVISVSPYCGIVTVSGGVKRPMKYEIKPGETLDKLLAYAGGFAQSAFSQSVHIDRIASDPNADGATGESFDVMAEQFPTFQLKDGDIITVNSNADRFKNRVQIEGAVWRPGIYAINGTTSTLKQLIQAAGGLRDDAYSDKGYIVRFGENRNKEQVSFNVNDVILGKTKISLLPDDYVQIYAIDSLKPVKTVKIYGEVNKPTGKISNGGETNVFEYREGMTIGDLILMAGGLTDAATLSKVEVARRLEIPSSGMDIMPTDTVATVLYYNLQKNPAHADVQLKPYDIVFVRRSASYKPQQTITIEGEVNYPGSYVVEKNVVRLSDVVEKAQGLNKDAYIKGAKLTRTLTKEEFDRIKLALEIARKQVGNNTAVDSLEIGESFNVAINLEEALKNPGSVADVILREGDVISIPKLNSTVKISGAVLYPNTVAFNPGKGWKYYISNAGGFNTNAYRGKVYIVHMNGSVASKGRAGFSVQPGSEIIVPTKTKGEKTQNLASIIGLATSTASLAAMVTTIINQMK